jgi:hypothetical protein
MCSSSRRRRRHLGHLARSGLADASGRRDRDRRARVLRARRQPRDPASLDSDITGDPDRAAAVLAAVTALALGWSERE